MTRRVRFYPDDTGYRAVLRRRAVAWLFPGRQSQAWFVQLAGNAGRTQFFESLGAAQQHVCAHFRAARPSAGIQGDN